MTCNIFKILYSPAKEDRLNLEQLERIRELEYENQRLNEYIEIQRHEISDFAKMGDESAGKSAN